MSNSRNGFLSINPCVSNNWKEYYIKYKYKDTVYNITVKNPSGKCTVVKSFVVNSKEIQEKKIRLDGSSNVYNIYVTLGDNE